MAVIVDFQAFKTLDNEFIIKEFAIVRLDSRHDLNLLVKPSQPFSTLSPIMQRRVNYLTRHIHGLRWDDGFITYKDTISIIKHVLLNRSISTIFVKGSERVQFLRTLLCSDEIAILDLDDFIQGKKEFFDKHTCLNHISNRGRCALHKARQYKNYLLKKYKWTFDTRNSIQWLSKYP